MSEKIEPIFTRSFDNQKSCVFEAIYRNDAMLNGKEAAKDKDALNGKDAKTQRMEIYECIKK